MTEKEIFDYLNKTSFIDIMKLISKYYDINFKSNNDVDTYYTAKDLYKLYPNVFSKYKLDKYIKEDNLPVIKNGKERLFLKSNIEEWLKRRSNSFFHTRG